MRKEFLDIMDSEIEYFDIANDQFSDAKGITRKNVEQVLKDRGTKLREKINHINETIKLSVVPFLEEPTRFSREEVLEFDAFADKLSGYVENIDRGLAFDIREAIIIYAEDKKDDELLIKNLFYKGLIIHYMAPKLYKKEAEECYEKIISYADRYESFKKETRNLIAKSFANRCLNSGYGDFKHKSYKVKKAKDFWENVAMKVDPDFPWDAFFWNINENFVTSGLTIMRDAIYSSLVDEEKKKEVYDSVCYLESKLQKNTDIKTNDYNSVDVKVGYYKKCVSYHCGLISVNELKAYLYDRFLNSGDGYSYDTIYSKIHFSALYFFYSRYGEDSLKNSLQIERIRKMEEQVKEYVENMPHDISPKYASNILTGFVHGSASVYDDLGFLTLLLDITIYRHKPTYVHSVMVAKIATIIAEFVLKYYPQEFIGLPEMNSVKHVVEEADEIIKFVWFSGLAHDMGKIVYSHLVSFYARKLNDIEFKMIKCHPSAICDFIAVGVKDGKVTQNLNVHDKISDLGFIETNQVFASIVEVALGHHKDFDGKNGYPVEFDNLKSKVKPIIDVITIADCIDAATDGVGRSYAFVKELDEVIDEFELYAGTRYNPTIAKLLKENEELRNLIADVIKNYRYDIYYSCFDKSAQIDATKAPDRIF